MRAATATVEFSRSATGGWPSVPYSAERKALVRAVSVAITLLIATAWFVFLRPSALGGPATYVIVSGSSMLPALESGDLVVAFDQETYSVGDVIVYRVPSADPGGGTQIVHRVIGHARGDGYVVRGDNREGPDYWRPSDEEVVGKLRLRIPAVGTALIYMRTTAGVALVAALTTIVVALGLFSPDRSPAKRTPVSRRVRPRPRRTAGQPIGLLVPGSASVWTRGLVIDARAPETVQTALRQESVVERVGPSGSTS